MQATSLGHRLETLHDGLTTFRDGEPVPMPLMATAISIRVVSGLAFVRTTRCFRNGEENPIEAVMTPWPSCGLPDDALNNLLIGG